MLASKPLLKNGRYKLEHLISAGPTAHLYKALDNLAKKPVVVLKNEIDASSSSGPGIDGQSLVTLRHDGLVRIADHFREGNASYVATEPLAGNASPNPHAADKIFQRLGVILNAICTLRSEFPSISRMEMSPQTFFMTAENKLKLLSTYPAEVVRPSDPVNSPYLPLERVWDELDHINQKAIYRTYDENALAVLESPADERSDLYSLGAVFYRLVTGVEPLSAFERSIDMLDTRVDPLTSPRKLNSDISIETSDFIMRLLELRRERRFDSTKDAISSLPSAPKTALQIPAASDDIDLLEIPDLGEAAVAIPVVIQSTVPVAAPAVVQETATEKAPAAQKPLVKERIVEPTPEIPLAAPEVVTETIIVPDVASASPEAVSNELFTIPKDEQIVPAKKSLKVAAIAAVAAVVLAAGGWGILTFGTASTSAVQLPAPALVEPPQTADLQPQVPPESATLPMAVPDITPSPSTEPAAKQTLAESGSSQSRPRPQIAEVKPAKPAEKKPNEERPKKKLTVDDLINDN